MKFRTADGQIYEVLDEPVWEPIETAPRDGANILVCWPQQGSLVMLVWYSPSHNYWRRPGGDAVVPMQATHWMPLPSPPKE